MTEIQEKKLEKKYQPQWYFKTKTSAKKELAFQKKYNPQTYKYLITKDIKVAGKRVSAKELIKPIKKKSSTSYWGPQLKLPKYKFTNL